MAYILIQGWPGEGVLRVLPRADPGLQPFDELLAVQGEHTEVVRLSLRAARRQGVRISVKVRGDERNFSIEHCTSGVPWLKTVVVFDHIFVYRLTSSQLKSALELVYFETLEGKGVKSVCSDWSLVTV